MARDFKKLHLLFHASTAYVHAFLEWGEVAEEVYRVGDPEKEIADITAGGGRRGVSNEHRQRVPEVDISRRVDDEGDAVLNLGAVLRRHSQGRSRGVPGDEDDLSRAQDIFRLRPYTGGPFALGRRASPLTRAKTLATPSVTTSCITDTP
ncbi:hypothetical protein DL770_009375 [Monosporascus sp. CRB-9-2]|nr:hypothetical protein DL770_009375 [Monosporascus sp. CRB-9-2]